MFSMIILNYHSEIYIYIYIYIGQGPKNKYLTLTGDQQLNLGDKKLPDLFERIVLYNGEKISMKMKHFLPLID